MLAAAGIARSTYYYTLKQFDRPEAYKEEKEIICHLFHENKGRYGYRRITQALQNRGVLMNHKVVCRLMKELGLVCKVRLHRYRSYKGEVGKKAPNLLNREFKTESPNQKWVTDVTEFKICGQKLYLSPILDLYNGEIKSFQVEERPGLSLVMDMLKKALKRLSNGSKLLLHSDQGWQYRHVSYCGLLEKYGITQSMSRKGNCYDNAVMENFFGHLKSELIYLEEFENVEEFKTALAEYIEYYNNCRIKMKLNGLSPVQYRLQNQAT